jgi:hypothetical protein
LKSRARRVRQRSFKVITQYPGYPGYISAPGTYC